MAPNFDLLLGTDEKALNLLLASIFTNDQGLFNVRINVNSQGLNTMEFQIREQPVISLEPSPALHALASSFVNENFAPEHAEEALATLVGSSVTITCPQVLIFDLQGPMGGEGSVVCGGNFRIVPSSNGGSAYSLVLSMTHAEFTMIDNPQLSTLFNNALAPQALNYFNSSVFPLVPIPASYPIAGITFSAPTLATETEATGNFLKAFTALGTVPPDLADVSLSPGVTSIAFDSNLLNAVVAALNVQQTIGYTGGIPTPNFSWDYHVTATAGTISLTEGAMVIPLNLDGGANFTFHTPGGLPNISFSGSIGGSCTAEATVFPRQNGLGVDFILQLTSIGGFDIKPSVDHLPAFINSMINTVFGALASNIGDMLVANMNGAEYTMFTLPAIPINTISQNQTSIVLQSTQVAIHANRMLLQAEMLVVPTGIV